MILDIWHLFCESILINVLRGKSDYLLFTHLLNTRKKKNQLRIPIRKKTIGQISLTYLGPKIYNLLPDIIKYINSLFKNKAKFFILCQPRMKANQLIDKKTTYYYNWWKCISVCSMNTLRFNSNAFMNPFQIILYLFYFNFHFYHGSLVHSFLFFEVSMLYNFLNFLIVNIVYIMVHFIQIFSIIFLQ